MSETMSGKEIAILVPERATAILLHKGDVLVLEFARRLTMEVGQKLREYVQKQFPGAEVLVLDDGTKLAAVLTTHATYENLRETR